MSELWKTMEHIKRRRIKVCHMSSVHGQEDTRIFHKECVSLARAGYEVYLITRGKTYSSQGVHIVGVEGVYSNRYTRMFNVTDKVYKKAVEIDADIYHAHDPELLPVLMKLKRRGKKVIFDSHEYIAGTIEEKTYIPKPFRKWVRWAYELYEAYVCKKLDAVITVRAETNETFEKKGCRHVISVCNFPVLDEAFFPPNYDANVIAFAGGISKQWNHDKIIRAIENIDGVKYVLCGPVDDAYLSYLKSFPGWKKVDYRGEVPFEQVADILRGASVGIAVLTPGINTNGKQGNMANTKIFEEMRAGLPVICTDFACWREFVEGDDCGICIDPGSIEQITDAIRKLITDPATAKAKGMNGRRLAETKFNWANEEKKLLALYDEIGREIIDG